MANINVLNNMTNTLNNIALQRVAPDEAEETKEIVREVVETFINNADFEIGGLKPGESLEVVTEVIEELKVAPPSPPQNDIEGLLSDLVKLLANLLRANVGSDADGLDLGVDHLLNLKLDDLDLLESLKSTIIMTDKPKLNFTDVETNLSQGLISSGVTGEKLKINFADDMTTKVSGNIAQAV